MSIKNKKLKTLLTDMSMKMAVSPVPESIQSMYDYLEDKFQEVDDMLNREVTAYMMLEDCQDGSAYARFFPSKDDAQEYANDQKQRYCDDVYSETFTITKDGVLEPTSGFDI